MFRPEPTRRAALVCSCAVLLCFLSSAKFIGVDFEDADGRRANPEAARMLKDAIFQDVRGLTDEQRRICVEKGAKFMDGNQSNG